MKVMICDICKKMVKDFSKTDTISFGMYDKIEVCESCLRKVRGFANSITVEGSNYDEDDDDDELI